MKVSVSLTDQDVKYLDQYAVQNGMASRSAALQRAVGFLRQSELGRAYAAAWEARDGADEEAWETTVADGLPPS